jgi:polyhydroxybutyrate depolymerase
MKKSIILFALISLVCLSQVNALWTNKTMVFGGLTRSYRVYQSANYNAAVPASLIIALHGLGDNMNNFSQIGFNYIADTANIICIFPQAVSDPFAGAAWNSRAGTYGYFPNSSVDDIGFINALVDTALAKYSIKKQQVYLCGFSMGGFMTERMGLQSNGHFAAFASMSGTIGNGITTFNPGRHVPIAHFHGTSDSTVYFAGNLYGMDADSLVKLWVTKNGCNPTPVAYNFPDNVSDGITVESFKYSGSDLDAEVWFYKITGMDHTVLFQPANDLTEILEVWLFFKRHKLLTAGINNNANNSENIQIFPNPANNWITVTGLPNISDEKTDISVYNLEGQLIIRQYATGETLDIDLCGLAKGIYILKASSSSYSITKKIVKE